MVNTHEINILLTKVTGTKLRKWTILIMRRKETSNYRNLDIYLLLLYNIIKFVCIVSLKQHQIKLEKDAHSDLLGDGV